MGKYTGTEAIKQIDECLKTFCEKFQGDHKWPEGDAKPDAGTMAMMEEMEKMEMGEDKPMEEGGEGEGEAKPEEMGEAKADGEMMAGTKIIDTSAFEECTAKTDLPKLLL